MSRIDVEIMKQNRETQRRADCFDELVGALWSVLPYANALRDYFEENGADTQKEDVAIKVARAALVKAEARNG